MGYSPQGRKESNTAEQLSTPCPIILFFFFLLLYLFAICLFIFWLHLVFTAACRLSLVLDIRGYTLVAVASLVAEHRLQTNGL